MSCDQCQWAVLNGTHFVHESNCPNEKKTWVPERGQWVRFVQCRECDADVEVGEPCRDCEESREFMVQALVGLGMDDADEDEEEEDELDEDCGVAGADSRQGV